MVCDRTQASQKRVSNLARETEQFSFIRTITVYSRSDRQKTETSNSALSTKRSSLSSSALAVEWQAPMTIASGWYAQNDKGASSLNNVILLPASEFDFGSKKKSFVSYLDKIVVVAATFYLGFVLWWFFGSKNALFALPWQDSQLSQADAEFVEYMQQSLELIELGEKTSTSSASKKSENTVFVPVYSSSQTSQTPQQTANNLPPLLPPPPPSQLTAINPPISATPIAPPSPPQESVEKAVVSTIEQPAPLQTETKTETAANSIPRTLVGVMELKENSAALFKINGTTHRVWVGEKIQDSDWTLKSVSSQEVVVSNGVKTQAVSVGGNL